MKGESYFVVKLSDQRYAGLWLRVLAAIVDLMILGVPLAVFVSFLTVVKGRPNPFLNLHPGEPPSEVISAYGMPSIIVILCFFILGSWFYFAILESSSWQATVGKKLFGLYVTNMIGSRLSFGRTSARFFTGRCLVHIPYCGIVYFVVDCVCAGVTSKKQALHDSIAGCLVLKKSKE